MSNKHKERVARFKVFADTLRSNDPIVYQGQFLSASDSQTYKFAIELQACLLSDLTGDRGSSDDTRILRWINSCRICDVHSLACFLKSCLTILHKYVEGDRYDYECFKHILQETGVDFSFFLEPISTYLVAFLKAPNPSDFSIINQHFTFISRLSFTDVDHSVNSMEEYLETEARFDDFKHDYAFYSQLNLVVKRWLANFTWDTFVPQHGTGATAGLKAPTICEKYHDIGSDTMLDYFLARVGTTIHEVTPLVPKNLDRTCDVIFVPKSMLTFRTISKEPTTLQYFQQGIWKQLDSFMCEHSYLSQRIHIHDQTFNQNKARKGSETGDYATIDLSSASDSVSWELVKSVFAGTPLLVGLFSTRSRFARLPDGRRIALNKFAPMGSALCFPIECLVFAAICECSGVSCDIQDNLHDYLVYGDDLIVPTKNVAKLISNLHRCGFVVNTRKSFFSPHNPFRESCGGEYYCGVDVTPLRLGRRFSAGPVDRYHPSRYQAYIDLANSSLSRQFLMVRTRIICELMSNPQCYLPVFSLDDTHLRSTHATNFHLRKIYFDWWQCDLSNHGAIDALTDQNDTRFDDSETIRLFEWFRLSRNRIRLELPEDLIRVAVGRTSVRLVSKLSCLDNVPQTTQCVE